MLLGYRIIDVNLPTVTKTIPRVISCRGVRILGKEQLFEVLTTKRDGSYPQLLNAGLSLNISPAHKYYLENQNNQLSWVYRDGDRVDRKSIPNPNMQSIVVDVPKGASMDKYGIYGDKAIPLVILAEYKDVTGTTRGYIVAEDGVDALSIMSLTVDELLNKAQLKEARQTREGRTNIGGIANAYIREGTIVAKSKYAENQSFFTITFITEKVANQQRMQQTQNVQAQQQRVQSQQAVQQQRPQAMQQRVQAQSGMQGRPVSQAQQPKPPIQAMGTRMVTVEPNELIVTVVPNKYCNNPTLTKLYLHDKVKEVSPDALVGCMNFAEFQTDSNNPHLRAVGGMLFSKYGAELIRVPPASANNVGQIPPYVQIIRKGAFRGCQSVRSIEIPSTVKCIESGAFCGLPNLEVVKCSAVQICSDAFVDCPKLHTFRLGYGVKVIEGTLIRNSPLLKYLILPDSIQKLKPMTYAAMTLDGYAAETKVHKLIENSGIQHIFVPNADKTTLNSWYSSLYTDDKMYNTSNGHRFYFRQNSENNLQQAGWINATELQEILVYIRKP